MLVFNTVLGEELLFRGFLLPRMNGAFGRGDWLANGVLFAAYHLHMPWSMLAPLADALVMRTRRSVTGAPGSGSRCTAPRASSSRSSSSCS
jgi:membrane protease YdiL (CAAX protease family)